MSVDLYISSPRLQRGPDSSVEAIMIDTVLTINYVNGKELNIRFPSQDMAVNIMEYIEKGGTFITPNNNDDIRIWVSPDHVTYMVAQPFKLKAVPDEEIV